MKTAALTSAGINSVSLQILTGPYELGYVDGLGSGDASGLEAVFLDTQKAVLRPT